jgi:hypothetical protein
MMRGSLMIFADDWGRHPSSCQHLVARLLHEYRVLWVNTIGTRRPRLSWATVCRGLEKARQWAAERGAGDPVTENLQVFSPLMWPWLSTPRDRTLNRALLRRQLEPLLRKLPSPITCVTTIPIVADLVGSLSVDRWVYYCVDDFSQWPGLDQAALADMEEKLLGKVDDVLAVSQALVRRVESHGRQATLLTHGVDLEFWKAGALPLARPECLHVGEPPYVMFWGVIDRRMDVTWVRSLSESLEEGSLLLIGPENDPDSALRELRRVHLLGPMDLTSLPALARHASALVMPYRDAPVTRAMQPLKLKEYLATDRPVITRRLPAVEEWTDCLDAAGTSDEFADLVRLRLTSGLPADQRASRRRLDGESWDAKARQFARFILEPSAAVSA